MSRKYESLKYAPAIEAVLDITTDEISSDQLAQFENLEKSFLKKFPNRKTLHFFETSLEVGPQQNINYKNRAVGFVYRTTNEKEISQFRLNGFSYNHLEPYPGWKKFIDAALKNWRIYKKTRKAIQIKRVGLRFINIIKVPNDADLSDYLKTILSSKKKGDLGKLKHFQYRYIRELDEFGSIAIINLAQNEVSEKETSFLFDIDVIRQEFPKGLEDKQILVYLEEMRSVKNTIFFDTLTNKALDRYR